MTTPSPSDELLALLPDEDTVRALLLRVRTQAYQEGAAAMYRRDRWEIREAFRSGQHVAVERDSATTYGAGYDAGYQDGARATSEAGP